ncbi:hypothetical protein JHK84_053430 [Glycine max]|uniref:Putative disease resistance protein RGA3 n=1 Tax=Glycine soja TaxID=3848 RepID=A0A445FGC9_GLYSO|nr:putative disease resistance protein RGA3 [Glycine soja]XP_028217513.1 putative disease resistance protein RGA3 [Glycine soja]KAG5083392.1 hypothetical protein JHK84_053430 [Glycine max]RZB47860.1 putative disease resistance protein RGA3 [Glycine soja]
MADFFVFDIAETLLEKLASYVSEEASRAYDVYEDLQGIKDTLSIVKGVLLDAEEKKEQKHGLREWLRQIQNVCFDAEDVLDGFECHNLRKQVVKASGSTGMKVGHFFSSSNSLVFRLRMARQIKHVRCRLDKIAADGNKFGLERISVDHRLVQRREMTYSHIDASGVMGRDNDREEIIKLLMQPHPHGDGDGDKSVCVIPIVGIGGLGKTTLARLVFNDKRMDELFQLKMWVCVSDDFDIRQIIIKIINCASASTSAPSIALAHHESINNLDIEQLQSQLRHKLSGLTYLLVLDDIWNDDRAKWIELNDLIKVGAVGSKILVTTRSDSIASMVGTVPSYVLEGLSVENCLSLFVKWAFKEGEEKKYPNLVDIGKEMVKKCQGVPLAVRTLGSSLFLNFDLERWEFVRDHEIWNLNQKKDDILPALKLSYDQMPSYLRQCFAYFSLFPKDFGHIGSHFVSLWGSFGLLRSPSGSQKVENIARQYIAELHSRSFLEDFVDFGHVYYFKVHDLVHDLASYVAKEEFLVVDSRTRNIPKQVRHLSVVENDSLSHALFPKSRSVRTIYFPMFGVGLDSEALMDTWIARYKYLRVLHLSDSSFETLPNSIAKLEHLRALNLANNCKIKRLPHSICKLQNLQVLSLRGCMELQTLPKGLGMLMSLRKFYITTKQSILSEDEFARLRNLHTLSFEYCDNLKFLFKVAQVSSLEVLIVQSCGSLESLPLHILPKLESLFVKRCERLNLSFNSESPIQKLRMKLLHLEHFPRQQILPQWIEGATNTLQTLFIVNFHSLEMLPEWLTTMTHVKMLHIVNCPRLLYFPSDMNRLSALEDLDIDGCPELCRKCQPLSGEYWSSIAHIKRVSFGEKKEGKLLFQTQTWIRLGLRD